MRRQGALAVPVHGMEVSLSVGGIAFEGGVRSLDQSTSVAGAIQASGSAHPDTGCEAAEVQMRTVDFKGRGLLKCCIVSGQLALDAFALAA